jgi:hypothetical protein
VALKLVHTRCVFCYVSDGIAGEITKPDNKVFVKDNFPVSRIDTQRIWTGAFVQYNKELIQLKDGEESD